MLSAIMAVIMTVVQPAIADNAKKVVGRGRSAVPTSAIRFATPMIGAADIIVNALGRQQTAPADKGTSRMQISDTTAGGSRIVSTRTCNDVVTVVVELAKDQQRLDLGVYNMLGKRINDVYVGPAGKGTHEFTTSSSDLPEGVYICIMKGDDFRRAAKFYLNR